MDIRVIVGSEVRFYREALRPALHVEHGVAVVGTSPPEEVLALLGSTRPDVLLLHVGVPAGPLLARTVRGTYPSVRVIALAAAEVDEVIMPWAEAGISGYVPRNASLEHLVDTIRIVARGEAACSPVVTAALLRRVAAFARPDTSQEVERVLAPRELQVVRLIEGGLSNKEIARRLSIALPTVKNHVHHILAKLGVCHRSEVRSRVRAFVAD